MITNETYFLEKEHMSVSLYKQFCKCELLALQGFGEPTSSMLVGSYVDAYVEGTLDQFKLEHPEILSSRGSTKGELKSEFKKADEICQFIENDTVFSKFMSGEKQTIMTGNINGVPWKIKMDSYSPKIAINDLKVMASITNSKGEYVDFISQWGYDIQLACYQEIVYQNTGDKLPCFICAVTKETPINSAIIKIPQHILDGALYRVQITAPYYYDVLKGKELAKGCNKCKVCITRRTTTPIISMEEIMDNGQI